MMPGTQTGPTPAPAFAGVATFLRAPQVPIGEIPLGQLAVAGVPIDGFADTPGTSEGPRGIREASVAFLAYLLPAMKGTLVDVDTERSIEFVPDMRLVDVGDVDPLLGPSGCRDRLAGHAAAMARRAALSVFLGGTRAMTAPLLEGIGTALGRRPSLLRLSATLDLADERSDVSMFPGASFLAAARYAAGAACLGMYGLLPTEEWRRADASGGFVLPLTEWRRRGLAAGVRAACDHLLSAADRLYLSVDIRVTDAAFAAARGRVVSGGMLPGELLEVAAMLATLPLAAIDMVEVAPPADTTRRAEHVAFRTLLALIEPRLAAGKATA